MTLVAAVTQYRTGTVSFMDSSGSISFGPKTWKRRRRPSTFIPVSRSFLRSVEVSTEYRIGPLAHLPAQLP
jgi:hypothetical protein